MNPIDFETMGKLSNAELCLRMDSVLKTARIEGTPFYNEQFDIEPYLHPFSKTKRIQRLDQANQRKAIWMAFDFILQMEYVSRYHGFKNSVLDSQDFDRSGWTSPRKYMAYLALEQASIVGSRIALERLMGLVYFVALEKELPKEASKFGKFKEWLLKLPVESDWFYLVPFLPWIREHDTEFRTAEVHDGSKLKKYMVALQDIPSEIKNDSLNLINILSNLWRSLLVLFDDQRPHGAVGIKASHDLNWIEDYVNRDREALEKIKIKVSETLSPRPLLANPSAAGEQP